MSALPSEEPTDHEVNSGVVRQFAAGPSMQPEDLTWQELRDIWWLVRSMNPETPAAGHPDLPEPPDLAEPSDPEPAAPRKPEPSQEGRPKRPDPPARQGQEEWVPHHRGIVRPTLLDSSRASAPLRWPALPALRDPRGIERALRPLTVRAPSPWRKVIDEDATATVAAEERIWLPQWKPEPWRQFELALVVDSSQTMEIWQQTVDEFTEILCHLGAFRNVRTYRFDGGHKTDPVLSVDGTDAPKTWPDIIDPTGRRVILVLTDAIGAAWRTGAAERAVANLAGRLPTAIVNVLDDRLRSWGGLSPQRVQVLSPRPGVPNSQLWPRPDPADAVLVPVLALTPDWLYGWANLLSGKGIVETTAVNLSRSGPVDATSYADVPPDPDPSPRDRVLRFRTYASLRAFQLACLIAAAPLNLPIIRLVEKVMLDGSDPSTVAEILLGGIIRPTPVLRSVTDPASITYEFHDGVREELLAMGTRADTVRVARILGDYAGAHVPILRSFRTVVVSPSPVVGHVEVTDENLPYLNIQAKILAPLSGPVYSGRSRSLTRAVLKYTDERTQRVDHAPRVEFVDNASGGIDQGARGRGVGDTLLTGTTEGRGDMSVSDSPSKTEPHKGIVVRPKIWGSVPLRNPDFVGRDEVLEKLQQRLLEPGATATAVLPEALHGMGGVGKSQTVVEYIYRHSAEYDIIWWIPSEQLSQINVSFVELAKKLGLPATSAETARPEVLEALRTSQRWLLVFDNAGTRRLTDGATVDEGESR